MAEEVYTLKSEDILQHRNLIELGALPGDKIVENKLRRVFSKEGDERKIGYSLTEEDILKHENLQKLKAEPGDQVVDGKLKRIKHDETWEQIKYGWDSAVGLEASLADILESNYPLGKFIIDFTPESLADFIRYETPEEYYGQGFNAASPKERREMILAKRNRELMEEWGPQMMQQDTLAKDVGQIAGALTTPSTLLAPGAKLTTVIGRATGLGAGFETAEQIRKEGEVVSPKRIATVGAISGATGGAIKVGVDKFAQRKANKIVSRIETEVAKRVNRGEEVASKELDEIAAELGISPIQKQNAYKVLGRNPYIPLRDPNDSAVSVALKNDESITRRVSRKTDQFLGAISTRIRNINPAIADQLKKFEFNAAIKTDDALKRIEPFLTSFSKVDPVIKADVERFLFNGDFKNARLLMQKYSPESNDAFEDVVKLLREIKTDYDAIGITLKGVDNYFPRSVKNYREFSSRVKGTDFNAVFEQQLQRFSKFKGIPVSDISEDIKADIIENVIRGNTVFQNKNGQVFFSKASNGKPSFTKTRTIDNIPSGYLEFYSSAEESLQKYIRTATNTIEKNRFFNGGQLKKTSTGVSDTDVDIKNGIGMLIEKEKAAGRIRPEDEDDLRSLLNSRFVHGEQNMNSSLKILRDTGYAGTIANPIAALTQLGDLGAAAAIKGPVNTLMGFARSISGQQRIGLKDIGLADDISKEFSDPGKLATALEKTMKVTGFKRLDRLGKESLINASFNKNISLAKSAKGRAKLKQKYGTLFGDEFEAVVRDLQNKQLTERTKLMSFSDLLDFQPVALSEFPEKYLRHPDGRIFYMLKSFTIKQWDLARREVFQKLKTKGQRVEGAKNLAALGLYLTASNTGSKLLKDMVLGKEIRPEDIPKEASWALAGVYGVNKYTYDKYFSQGKPIDAVVNTLVPATPMLESIGRAIYEGTTQEEPEYGPALKGIPGIGPIAYYWFGGGIEKDQEKKFKENVRLPRLDD